MPLSNIVEACFSSNDVRLVKSTLISYSLISFGLSKPVLTKPHNSIRGWSNLSFGLETYSCTTSLPGVLPVFSTFSFTTSSFSFSFVSTGLISKLVYESPNPNGKRTSLLKVEK